MKVDESKMKVWKETSVWKKLRNSVIALLFGLFLLTVTPLYFAIVYLPDTILYLVLGLYATSCLFLGWFYGDYFISYLHAKIENWWDPRDMFR